MYRYGLVDTLVTHANTKWFDLTSLSGVRRGFLPPQLKTKQKHYPEHYPPKEKVLESAHDRDLKYVFGKKLPFATPLSSHFHWGLAFFLKLAVLEIAFLKVAVLEIAVLKGSCFKG